MASPPAKRQRRSTIVLSDDEDAIDEPQLPPRASSKSSTRLRQSEGVKDATSLLRSPSKAKKASKSKSVIAKASPKSSPEKAKKGKVKKEPERSKSLYTFFDKASEEQRWRRKSKTPDEYIDHGELGDAIVDDDSLDEAFAELADTKDTAQNELDRWTAATASFSNGPSSSQRQPPSSTPRFVKPAIPVKRAHPTSASTAPVHEECRRPWSDRYAPSSLEELAVHKKKVSDVQKWLSDVLAGRDQRKLLVLKGPAGSGKSTTLSLLAKALGCSLVWWNNPTATEAGTGSSISSQFDDFLNRSGHYGSLRFDEPNSQLDDIAKPSTSKILVVEEFPTTMTRSSLALESFRKVLMQFVATSDSNLTQIFTARHQPPNSSPLVAIITETLLTSTTAATDSFTAHRLLGPEISNHPLVTIMEFNPVAPTFVAKALELVVKKEARHSRRRRVPGSAVLQRLADIGDIRSAVNSLEFLCIRGDANGDWSGTVATKAKHSGKDGVPLTVMEQNSLEMVSQRETSLDMFHATGKVVYNKREDPRMSDTRAEPPPKPPDHLENLHKPKVSQVDIEALLNETGTDIQTFLSTLHENYVLSCNSNNFSESFEGCSDFLSDSDVLNPDARSISRSGRGASRVSKPVFQAGSTDALRQDEISFQVATRGLLFALPFPVNRAAHPGGRKGDSFKMFYPASLRLWKPTEELESMIAMYMTPSPDYSASTASIASVIEGVASWRARAAEEFQAGQHDGQATAEGSETPRTYLSRDELILETLPYLFKIKSSRKEDVRTLNKITQFNGLRIAESAEEPFDEDRDADPTSVQISPVPTRSETQNTRVADALSRFTQSQSRIPTNSLIALRGARTGASSGLPLQEIAMEKLYISDDDIVDD